ncbi:hypothetical protein OWM54_39585 [Myxococcus sp. MISCRS1]|jgi:hypothetical protein|uniref:Uncharacterized protein n=1 Tax=Myxococcus fulvus TaxID=33 RepID=A0A511TFG2_MYXFU|nr:MULTISPECIES: hypothetical protein [Myxococcus]BDT35150.1 hypothetical protein MFMH1_48190 [Myxococcus sp. MH1]MBZ4398216.1 hypothetical protein [Myxococcus sp. AS-1-15]MBZ4409098.1 hypothetical protein [Myxococcus sp. XM-1-1-1]MCK8499374.1 hypothetical protein [Myxococcus fulvus]MCY1003267.1 hypothetical protein [Myxococcus sp. MISCRS1]
MGARHTRLAAALAAAWEAEVVSARRMTMLAERIMDARMRARLMVLAAFCRAHASRLLARLAALGRGPLPVPPEEIILDPDTLLELRREGAFARASAARYEATAELARQQADLSSAWVCELNRTEEQDRSRELLTMAEGALAGATMASPAQAAAPADS